MTVVISIASPTFLVVAIDSVVSYDYGDWVDRKNENKIYPSRNTYVASWGDRTGVALPALLAGLDDSTRADPEKLSARLERYLEREYQPRERGLGHLGFHVGGRGTDGRWRLFNVFWEPNGVLPDTPPEGRYGRNDHSPSTGPSFLFSGRHDVADAPVTKPVENVKAGRQVNFDVFHPNGAARFADFVVRFAIELTPDVGLPVRVFTFRQDGASNEWKNQHLAPPGPSFDEELGKFLLAAG